MVGTRTPTTRRRSARFARRYAATESSQRSALECILAHDGPGGRPIVVSERNFFAELKRRNVYEVGVTIPTMHPFAKLWKNRCLACAERMVSAFPARYL